MGCLAAAAEKKSKRSCEKVPPKLLHLLCNAGNGKTGLRPTDTTNTQSQTETATARYRATHAPESDGQEGGVFSAFFSVAHEADRWRRRTLMPALLDYSNSNSSSTSSCCCNHKSQRMLLLLEWRISRKSPPILH